MGLNIGNEENGFTLPEETCGHNFSYSRVM